LEIADLRGELDARPTCDELESVRKEWATSEDLFAQSQKWVAQLAKLTRQRQ